MKGYWHLPAMAVAGSFMALRFETMILFVIMMVWLFALLLWKRLGKLPVLLSLLVFSFFYFYLPPPQTFSDLVSPSKTLTTVLKGRITSAPEISEKKISFTLQERTANKKIQAIYFITEKTQKAVMEKWKSQFKRGANCTLKGKVGVPQPGTNPGEFDFQKFSRDKGIAYQMILSEPSDISCSGSSIFHMIDKRRDLLLKSAEESYSATTAAWLKALVLGDDSSIPENVIAMFRDWSLSHLLAISGLHVGLIVSLIYFLLIKTGFVTIETAKWIVVIFLPLYCFIAGSQPSVIRASLMGMLLILFSIFNRKVTISDTISIVFLMIIFLDKHIVSQVGFQLSFLVTFSLILSKDWLAKTNSLFFQMLSISFISQMVILPIQILYFSSFQPLSILLNVLVVPYFSFFVIPLMFACLLLAPLSPLLFWLDLLFQETHSIFLHVLTYVNRIASFPWMYGDFPGWAQMSYYCLLVLLMISLLKEKRKQALLQGTLLVLLVMSVISMPYFSPYGKLTMLDIGQGDAFLLELPYRKGVFFIDAGAKFEFDSGQANDSVYTRIIQPYLKKSGINVIDGIFISHEDVDHMGSVDYMVNDFRVKNIIISHYYPLEEEQADLWTEHGTSIYRIDQGSQIEIAGQKFVIVSPLVKTESANENSLVLWTEFGGKSWLFTGDIGKDTEKRIIQMYPKLKADVLKIGHHGSKNSSDKSFINQINPKFGMISAGRQNRYGHPHQEVLDVLSEEQVIILRTDQNGAIIYKFKRNLGTFSPYVP